MATESGLKAGTESHGPPTAEVVTVGTTTVANRLMVQHPRQRRANALVLLLPSAPLLLGRAVRVGGVEAPFLARRWRGSFWGEVRLQEVLVDIFGTQRVKAVSTSFRDASGFAEFRGVDRAVGG